MVNDDTIALLEAPHPGTALDYLAGRLMAGDFILISFGPLPEMLPVNGPDIASANSGGFHPDKYLSVARFRNRNFLEDNCTIPRKIRCFHTFFHNLLLPSVIVC
jgi:hypothetical protein